MAICSCHSPVLVLTPFFRNNLIYLLYPTLPYPTPPFRPSLSFRWTWRSARARADDVLFPITEKIIVNHFYRENGGIWTPWMVRFAYETGSKCLYSNLPGNLSLVTNHREKGENYGETMVGVHFRYGCCCCCCLYCCFCCCLSYCLYCCIYCSVITFLLHKPDHSSL